MTLYKNLIANLSLKFWIMGLALVSIPLQINILGPEAYGIVALYISSSFLFLFLDLGISHTVVREMARSQSAKTDHEREYFNDLFRTIEFIILAIGLLIFLIGAHNSEWLARNYLTLENITVESASLAIQLLFFSIALTWVISFYRNVLIGIQFHVVLSKIEAVSAFARYILILFPVYFLGPDIALYMTTLSLFLTVESLVFMIISRKKTFSTIGKKGKIRLSAIKPVVSYSAWTGFTSIFGSSVSMMDTILLPGMLSLTQYGYYAAIRFLGRSLIQISQPITRSFRPRFIKMIEDNDKDINFTYRIALQINTLIMIPIGLNIALFSHSILNIWSGDKELAEIGYLALSFMVIGTIMNSYMSVIYSLQLAYNWVKFAFYTNMVLFIVMIPLLFLLSKNMGINGAAISWLILNSIYFIIFSVIFHRKFNLQATYIEFVLTLAKSVLVVFSLFLGCTYILGESIYSIFFSILFSFVVIFFNLDDLRKLVSSVLWSN